MGIWSIVRVYEGAYGTLYVSMRGQWTYGALYVCISEMLVCIMSHLGMQLMARGAGHPHASRDNSGEFVQFIVCSHSPVC